MTRDISSDNNEINEIIARAMADYERAHNIESQTNIPETPEPIEETPEIPPYIEGVVVLEDTSRFSGAIWYSKIQEQTVTLAGVGGIGSYVAFLLSRVHPSKIIMYDDDRVDLSNMSGQLYRYSDVGEYKVYAVSNILNNFSNHFSHFCNNCKFTETTTPTDIMICGFDNMEARKVFFNSWLSHTKAEGVDASKCLFIDGRLAAEEFQVFAIVGNDLRAIEEYKNKWLFGDYEAEPTLCSYKQTSFCANMIASIMVNLFVNFIANQCDPLVPRDLPFMTSYNAETMFFKVIQ